jgi:hypothetical protein
MSYDGLKITLGVLATIGLYTVLYRENKFYRFWEHVFVGLAAGWALVTLWVETLKPSWWDKMVGRIAEGDAVQAVPGYWAWAFMLPLGVAGYFVFSKKHSWVARLPIGVIIGLWSGQQFNAWIQRFWPQLNVSMVPLIPTTMDSVTVPYVDENTPAELATQVSQNVYLSQAIGNIIATVTLLTVLIYFLFSFDVKNKLIANASRLGRYLLMIGFGAIFGSTVMMRFSLLIDRMYFIWIEWLQQGIIEGRFFGGGPGAG